MSKQVLIVKNITREGPGILENELRQRGLQYKIVDLNQGEEFPGVDNFAAVVVLGGPDSANDQTPKMLQELEQIKRVLELGIPYLGICLGLQTLVMAAGGEVVKSPLKEVGFLDPEQNHFRIELSAEGQADSLFKNLGNSFKVFHLHGETVEITDKMKLLGIGKFCKNQIVKVGTNAYGIQCHFELTSEMFETWLAEDPDLLAMDQSELRKLFTEIEIEYTQTGQRLFRNFLDLI